MKKWIRAVAVLLLLYLQQFQLSYSATVGLKNNLTIALPWVLMNMLIVALPFLLALVITKRIKWAIFANSILFTVLSLINYHVLLFHGKPFLAGDIFSIPTAINVMSEYSVVFDNIVIRLIALFGIELVVWLAVYCFPHGNRVEEKPVRRRTSLLASVLSIACVAVLFFSPYAVFKRNLITWSWGPAMNQYGYGVCFCNSIYAISHFTSEPENYNIDAIACHDSDDLQKEENEDFPDIILILNESLADLNVYLDLQESRMVFSALEDIDGLISGYTVSSMIGGGTNNSEYELLTSNSMQVLNVSAPFVSLNMTGSTSIVSYLNELQYTTVGMHCGNASNYNRNNAYEDMGFDQIRLGREDFSYYSENGNRPWLDRDNYRDMLELYEACDDNPRFLYLLTYQNHGGYEQNEAAADTVEISGDYGEFTDDINEYLTSVKKSVEAFTELIHYFETSDRPVVVMMLGDHGPAFLSAVPSDKDLTGYQQDIAKRSVPYFVWSNTEIDTSVFPAYASMVDLVPLMLKSVDMPLTGYYKTIIDLNKVIPVRTAAGLYVDAAGEIGNVLPGMPHYGEIQNYYYLEYHNLVRDQDYNSSWFVLKTNESVQ